METDSRIAEPVVVLVHGVLFRFIDGVAMPGLVELAYLVTIGAVAGQGEAAGAK